ncbi:MAG: GHMP kinase [Peptococcaceae bacterium]|nr:GHMP kinase [Peptococcaceae bacterium]
MQHVGAALCPGSCGELVQGTWDGVNFLVPCPIDLYSYARVSLSPGAKLCGPTDKPKALSAVKNTLEFLGQAELGGELCLKSEIPTGKGMASSTADIGAAIAATASALGANLSPRTIAALAVSIEPTDGTVLPGITLFDHLKGSWQLPLGKGPEAQILALDLGGEVNTLEFNALPGLEEQNKRNETLSRQAFSLVRQGIRQRDLGLLGRGTSISAQANQSILPKALLPEIYRWGLTRGAFGVIAAHSGTVIGLLYAPERDLQREATAIQQEFAALEVSWLVRLVPGGVKVVQPDGYPWRKLACRS